MKHVSNLPYKFCRYIDSAHESLPYMESKRATVHPQVVYDIPKNTQVYVSPHHQMNGITSECPMSFAKTNKESVFLHSYCIYQNN